MGIREQFCNKLYDELQEYKDSLKIKNSDRTGDVKVNVLSNIYDMLIMSADDFSEVLLMKLINQSTSILESIYFKIGEQGNDAERVYADMKQYMEEPCKENADEAMWWEKLGYGKGEG